MKLLGVEAARGIAALMVLLLHASGLMSEPRDYGRMAFGNFFGFGRAGVDFFFVLSGFIITYVHYNDLGRARVFPSFWRKRLLRIYPAYWAAFAYLGAILFISPTRSRAEQDPGHIIASFFLFPEAIEPILGVAWSLRHELLFYLLFSVALLNRRLGIALMAAWFVAVFGNSLYSMATGRPYIAGGIMGSLVFRVFNIQFLPGIVVAILIRRGSAWHPGAMLAVGIAIFFANGMVESFLPPVQHEWPPRHWLYAIGSAYAIYGLAVLDLQRAWRIPGFLLRMGAASYSIYLVHGTTLLLLQQVVRYTRPFLNMPLELTYIFVVASALAVGFAFHYMIEKPVLRSGNRLFVTERSAS